MKFRIFLLFLVFVWNTLYTEDEVDDLFGVPAPVYDNPVIAEMDLDKLSLLSLDAAPVVLSKFDKKIQVLSL